MIDIIELIKQPWSWWFSGIMIAGIMIMLNLWGKSFGFSSNLRTVCSIAGAGKKVKLFDFDWRSQIWNLLFLVGSVLGGWIAANYLSTPEELKLSAATISDLNALGFTFNGGLNPDELFSWQAMVNPVNVMLLLLAGLLVGFGSRYAGGCTSGHAISGLSNLQIPSLIAVVGFFIGGLAMTHVLMPFIFS